MPPTGFYNIGFTCYFNVIIQSLLSTKPFIKHLLDKYHEKNLDYIEHPIIKIFHSGTNPPHEFAIHIWKEFMTIINKDYRRLDPGQQCSAEALTLLLESLEVFPQIQSLFNFNIQSSIFCTHCGKNTSITQVANNMYYCPPELISEQHSTFASIDAYYNKPQSLEDFILENNTYLEDYKCGCVLRNETQNKIFFQNNKIQNLPEIFIIVSKKYKKNGEKYHTKLNFPEFLEFEFPYKKKYRAVSFIDHLGHTGNSGHYVNRCLRGNKWYACNDMHISDCEFDTNQNTYIGIYTFV